MLIGSRTRPGDTAALIFIAECVFFKTERDIYIRKLLNTSELQGVHLVKIEDPEILKQPTLDLCISKIGA